MTVVKFERCGTEWVVRFPYNPTAVETLKASVPYFARQWKPIAKEWVIGSMYGPDLAAALQAVGCTVIGLTTDPPPTSSSRGRGGDWAQLLFKAVGPARAAAVHRALTKVLHPDTPTGDTKLQRELNDARDQLMKGHP